MVWKVVWKVVWDGDGSLEDGCSGREVSSFFSFSQPA